MAAQIEITFTHIFNVASNSTRKFLALLYVLLYIGAHGSSNWEHMEHTMKALPSPTNHHLQFSTFCDGTHLFYGLILGTSASRFHAFLCPPPTFLGFKFMDFVLLSFRCPELASLFFFPLVMYRQNAKLKKKDFFLRFSVARRKKSGKKIAIFIQLVFIL